MNYRDPLGKFLTLKKASFYLNLAFKRCHKQYVQNKRYGSQYNLIHGCSHESTGLFYFISLLLNSYKVVYQG